MSELMKKLKNVGTIKNSDIVSKSLFFTDKDSIPTKLPILNVAFSGKLDGGLVSGLTVISGFSKTLKTILTLYCMKAYLDKYEDGIGILFDNEFGITPDNIKSLGIDPDRILHVPIENIEELKFDMVKRLEKIERNDHVFMMIDSLGSLPSKKEIDDALDEKSVADMTRAKAIRSLFRIITPILTIKDIPCICIAHTYSTMELYSKSVVGGGASVMYSPNQVFIISKAQEKDGDALAGFIFTINIEKSRFVKEKSKFPILVTFDKGISKYSGLLDIAIDLGYVVKVAKNTPSKSNIEIGETKDKKSKTSYYSRIDIETGEIEDKKYKAKDTNNKEFWEPILNSEKFTDAVYNKYSISSHSIITDDTIQEEIEEIAAGEENND